MGNLDGEGGDGSIYISVHMHTSLLVFYTAELVTDEQQAEAQTFYEDLGTLAQEKKSVTTHLPLTPCIYFTIIFLFLIPTQCDGVVGVYQGN